MHCVRLSRISLVYPIQLSQALLLPVLLWLVFFSGLLHAQTAEATLRGVVTDPSGASVPGALVQVLQAGAERRATTNNSGQYQIGPLTPGTYRIRVLAKANPVNWAVAAARAAMLGNDWATAGKAALGLCLFAALAVAVATQAFKAYRRAA